VSNPERPTLQSIYSARARIAPHVMRTPLIPIGHTLGCDNDFMLKCEFMQASGAFKMRGATNRILTMAPEARARGVITVSTGNHGRAVATVARRLGIEATVCVSKLVPEYKLAKLKASGATLRIIGADQDETATLTFDMAEREGLTLVHPFDDPEVIAGQGTVALELMEDMPAISCVVAGIGGGGLISGVALAMKSVNPRIRVIGVQMDRGPVMYESVKAGHIVDLPELPTLADSLAGSLYPGNALTFKMVSELVDDIVLVSETQIADAMLRVWQDTHYVLEGASAAPVAAMLAGKISNGSDESIAVIGSGGSVSVATLVSLMHEGVPHDPRSAA
jgi:threonine dehydratase